MNFIELPVKLVTYKENEDGITEENDAGVDWCVFREEYIENLQYYFQNDEGNTNLVIDEMTSFVITMSAKDFSNKLKELRHTIIK